MAAGAGGVQGFAQGGSFDFGFSVVSSTIVASVMITSSVCVAVSFAPSPVTWRVSSSSPGFPSFLEAVDAANQLPGAEAPPRVVVEAFAKPALEDRLLDDIAAAKSQSAPAFPPGGLAADAALAARGSLSMTSASFSPVPPFVLEALLVTAAWASQSFSSASPLASPHVADAPLVVK